MHQSGWTEMRLWAFHFNVSVNEALTTNLIVVALLSQPSHPTWSSYVFQFQNACLAAWSHGDWTPWIESWLVAVYCSTICAAGTSTLIKLHDEAKSNFHIHQYSTALSDCLGIVAKSEASSAALSNATNLMPSFLIDLMIQTIMLVQHLPAWDKVTSSEEQNCREETWSDLIRINWWYKMKHFNLSKYNKVYIYTGKHLHRQGSFSDTKRSLSTGRLQQTNGI